MRGQRSPWLVLGVLCLGQSVVLLDTTIVNVAIPSMISDLGASLEKILWVNNAYLLAYAVLLVPAGRLGDVVSPRTLFLAGLALFTAASTACGLAQDPTQLIAARGVQGIGAALMTPQSLALISTLFEEGRRGAAFGVWGSIAGIAAAAGPTVGGLMIGSWGWRWVFFVNLPIGLLSLALALAFVPRTAPGRGRRLDLLGAALLTAGLFLISYGLIEGEPHGWGAVWGPLTAPMIIVGGVGLLGAFIAVEYRNQDRMPLLPFAILRDRNFTLIAVVVWTLPFGLGVMLFLTLLYLQFVLGMTALSAGLVVASAPLVSIFVAPGAGRLVDRFGGKYVLVAGFALFAIGLGGLAAAAAPTAPWWALLPGLVVFGIGMGVALAPPAAIALAGITPAMTGVASGVFNMSRLCGNVIGAAGAGALLQVALAAALPAAAGHHAGEVPAQVRAQFVEAASGSAGHGLDPEAVISQVDTDALAEPGLSALRDAAHGVLQEALSDAVRISYLLPVLVLVAAAVVTLGVRQPPRPPRTGAAAEPAVPALVAPSGALAVPSRS